MRKWQCSVCGYIHTGDEPPEKCPVCGAPREKFVEITDPAEDREISEAPVETTSFEPPETGAPDRRSLLYESITDKMVVLHAHPISVHIPNGVLPVSVLFLFIAAVFQLEALGRAAFYNMIIVFLAMPFVLFSGYNDWKKRLGGNMTNIVLTKMICGGTVLTLSFVLVLWWILDPGVLTGGAHRGLFMFLHIVLLAAAVVAGYMGGKLVFKDPK